MRAIATLAVALLLAACSPAPAQAPIAEQWRAVRLEASPVSFGAAQIGALSFRGGLELRSPEAGFGGLSGMEVLEDGRMLAISDQGAWFEAQLVLDEAGALIGVSGMRMALMRDEEGAHFESKRAGDSEALTQLPDGRFAVAFEQEQVVRLYDLNRDGPFGAAARGPALAGVAQLRANVGLEAMAAAGDGALIVGAEGGGRAATPIWRAPLEASAPTPSSARYRPAWGYSLSGLDRLPNGDLVALERFYAPVIGARARITRIPARLVERGGDIDAEALAQLAPPLPVENFEAIAAIERLGVTRIYILSDNNFNARQRTLLLAFDLAVRPQDFSERTARFDRAPE